MRTPWHLVGIALLLVLFLGLVGVPQPGKDGGVVGRLETDVARSIITLTNAAREKHSLRALSVDSRLTAAAERYAKVMAQHERFDHINTDGSTIVQRAETDGYLSWAYLGENLASGAGPPDPAAVVNAWMNSPGHRKNLLSSDLQEVGVGCYVRSKPDFRYWCVQDFGTKRP